MLGPTAPCSVCKAPMGHIRNRLAEKLNETTVSHSTKFRQIHQSTKKFNMCLEKHVDKEESKGFLYTQLQITLQSLLVVLPYKPVIHVAAAERHRRDYLFVIFCLGFLSFYIMSCWFETTTTFLLHRRIPESRICSPEVENNTGCIDFLVTEGLADSIALIRNYSNQECLRVVRQCEAAADGNVGYLQLWLANVHEHGLCGRPVDEAVAAWYLRRAADLGVAEAQYNLALYYTDGTGGLAHDDQAAERYLRLAAEQGLIEALRRLSKQHKLGVGAVQKDREAAKRYWNLAMNTTQNVGTGGKRMRLKWRRRIRRAQ
jgi:hypothetical protein